MCRKFRLRIPKWLVVLVGVSSTVGLMYWAKDTRSVIGEFVETQILFERLKALNPQSPEEFWAVAMTAVKIDGRSTTPFQEIRDTNERLIDYLTWEVDPVTHRYRRVYKPWADEQFRKEAYQRLSHWPYAGWGSEAYDQRCDHARSAWSTYPERFWKKALGSVATGGVIVVLGLFCLPYITVLLLACVLVLSRGSHSNPILHQNQTPKIIETQDGGGGPEKLIGDGQQAIVPDSKLVWPVVLVIMVVVMLLDRRRLLQVIRLGLSRAPPYERRRAMKFRWAAVTLACCCFPLAAQAKQSLLFQFGEWPNARGSRVVLIKETERLESQPSVFLDGRAVEYLGLVHLTKRVGQLWLGPIVGGQNFEDGLEPYAGAVGRWQIRADSLTVFAQGATRHTRDERISHIVLAGVNYRLDKLIIGAAYQPVLRQQPWDQRIALNVGHKFKGFILALESRVSLNEGHRTSLNADVKIPLK